MTSSLFCGSMLWRLFGEIFGKHSKIFQKETGTNCRWRIDSQFFFLQEGILLNGLKQNSRFAIWFRFLVVVFSNRIGVCESPLFSWRLLCKILSSFFRPKLINKNFAALKWSFCVSKLSSYFSFFSKILIVNKN